MKAVEQQILDTGQVGGSNEFPKVEAERTCETCFMHGSPRQHACERCFECPDKDGKLTFWESPYAANTAAPIAPAAVADEGEDTKAVSDLLNSLKVIDRTQYHSECRSDVLRALMYELVSFRTGTPQQHIANLESELQIARDLIEQMRQQLSAANLGSSMQHERYGSY